jgi:hypothetical protein
MILRGIEDGELVGIRRKQADMSASKDPVVEQQRLVRDLESKTRGRLSEGGRQFKLIAGADLPGIPDRDSYEVVSNQEARRVLGTWVEQAGTRADLATLLGKAQDMLSPDWRPPMIEETLVGDPREDRRGLEIEGRKPYRGSLQRRQTARAHAGG